MLWWAEVRQRGRLQVEALCTAAQQATKLLREAKLLRTSADEGVALRGQVTELLAAASESAAAAQLLQGEHAQAISDLAAAHDELQVCKAEVVRVQKQVRWHQLCCPGDMPLPDHKCLCTARAGHMCGRAP